MKYIFKQSKIWEGAGDTVDPTGERVSVKSTSEERARKRLPDPGLGRNWILIETRNSFNEK
jgi:hypothetical protein